METQDRNTSLENALRGYLLEKDRTGLQSDLERLFDTLSGENPQSEVRNVRLDIALTVSGVILFF